MQPRLKTIELNHKLVSAALLLNVLPLNSEYFGSEGTSWTWGKVASTPHTKMGLPRRSQRLELEFRQLQLSGNVASPSKGPREGLWCLQLPQTFPDHKNDPLLIPSKP